MGVLFVRYFKLSFIDGMFSYIVTAAYSNSPCEGIELW